MNYAYGQDGQRTNKYTQSSETLYFNKMWTHHTDNGNNVYGGQTSKNIYLGETRIVTKLNSGSEPKYQEEYYKQYYYHSDHLGSASLISDYKGDEYQRIEYTPYGEIWVEKTDPNANLNFLPYKFTAKEMDEETGLYYYGARYLDPRYSMWISTDPALGEYIPKAPVNEEAKRYNQNLPGMGGVFNHINGNLFAYAANNPLRYIDPDGKSPVYNTNGDLIGVTDDTGLHGTPYFLDMAADKFLEAKMSKDEVISKNLGISGLKNETAVKNYVASYSNLKSRPDWDGKLTLDEANEWYRNGNGKALFIDMKSLDLSMLYSLGDDYIGEIYSFNLQRLGSKDGLVYGNLKFRRYPNDTCRAFQDTYDFDMHPWTISSMLRNVATIFGSLYAGKGTPYKINFYGLQTLQKAW